MTALLYAVVPKFEETKKTATLAISSIATMRAAFEIAGVDNEATAAIVIYYCLFLLLIIAFEFELCWELVAQAPRAGIVRVATTRTTS